MPKHHAAGSNQPHEYETISIKKYQKLKTELKKMEATNHSHIYIIPCNGSKGWLEFAEHSALFFYYGPCQKFHLNYKFMDDVASFYNQYEIGYMHTLSVNAIVNHLKRAGLFQNLEKRDYFTIIKLNKTYSSQEIEDLKNTENARRLEHLVIKNAVNLDPKLYQTLINLSVRLHKICNHQLDKLSVLTIGARIVNLIDDTLATYHQITMMKGVDKSKILEKLSHMRKNIYALSIEVKIAGEAKLWDLTLCISLAEPIDAARVHVERDIKRLGSKSSQLPNHPTQAELHLAQSVPHPAETELSIQTQSHNTSMELSTHDRAG